MKWISENLSFLTTNSYYDTNLAQWILLIAISCFIYYLLKLTLSKVSDRLKTISESTPSKIDDVLYRMVLHAKKAFMLALGIYLSALVVGVSDKAFPLFSKIFMIAAFYQVAVWGTEILSFYLKQYLFRRSGLQDQKDFHLSTYSAINISAKFLLWAVLFLLLLDNLGVNISALVTGLGIGGIAIALAVQNILGDIFASLTIVLDQPFQVGDNIVVGDKSGTVEAIGLKTSRVRSPSGEQLVFPNKKLIETDIKNFKRLEKRTVTFTFSLFHDTSTEIIKNIPEMLKEIISAKKDVIFERAHFKEFGKEALIFEVVYSINNSSYDYYMDVQQEINIELMEKVKGVGGKFAFEKAK